MNVNMGKKTAERAFGGCLLNHEHVIMVLRCEEVRVGGEGVGGERVGEWGVRVWGSGSEGV